MEQINECMICGLPNDETSFSLTCGSVNEKHTFHTICLNNALKIPTNQHASFSVIQKQCPYCRFKISGFIPLPKGTKPVKGLHKEYVSKVPGLSHTRPPVKMTCCQAICKSGKNKGKQCTNFGYYNYSFDEINNKVYCGVHKPKLSPSQAQLALAQLTVPSSTPSPAAGEYDW